MVGTLSNMPLPATIPPYIFPGILTVVPLKIVFPPLYLESCVNFGLAARIAETVVLLALAILDRVCPLLTVTVVDVVLVVPPPGGPTLLPGSAPGPGPPSGPAPTPFAPPPVVKNTFLRFCNSANRFLASVCKSTITDLRAEESPVAALSILFKNVELLILTPASLARSRAFAASLI